MSDVDEVFEGDESVGIEFCAEKNDIGKINQLLETLTSMVEEDDIDGIHSYLKENKIEPGVIPNELQPFSDNLTEFANGDINFELNKVKSNKYQLEFHINDMCDYNLTLQLMKIFHLIGATKINGSFAGEYVSGSWKLDNSGNIIEISLEHQE